MASNETGAFVPLTNIWDPETINKPENSPESKELKLRLYQNVSNISQVINNKVTGFYDTNEFVTGATFFANPNPIAGQPSDRRQVYRSVVNFGTLTNVGLNTVAHNLPLNSASSVVQIYGGATDPTGLLSFIPLPYVAPAGSHICLYADKTNVYINTLATDRSAYTIVYVVIEYLKQ